jgi:tetratricopeptide (TPR) repeat protein
VYLIYFIYTMAVAPDAQENNIVLNKGLIFSLIISIIAAIIWIILAILKRNDKSKTKMDYTINESGYVVATEVLEKLKQEGKTNSFFLLLTAINDYNQGQTSLQEGKFKDAIEKCKAAEIKLKLIPEAKYILGMCKVDLSAAFGNLSDYKNVIKYAREALELIKNKPELIYIQGTTNMNLGFALYRIGELQLAKDHLFLAMTILNNIPKGKCLCNNISGAYFEICNKLGEI